MKKILVMVVIFIFGMCAQAHAFGWNPWGVNNGGSYAELDGKATFGTLSHDSTYNIKDFGAKGDGVTGDNAAIISGLDFAAARWTADNDAKTTLYFPTGDYALINPAQADTPGGISYSFPDGFGGLTITGDGGNASRLLWTGDNAMHASSVVYALQIHTTTYPATADAQWLHDIAIVDFGVADDDPDTHEIAGGEETHGFRITYANRVTYDSVMVDSCGDEYMIVDNCHDVLFDNCVARNNLFSSASGSTNAGINIMNGCENVVVSGCRLFSSDDAKKGGAGISIEMQDTDLNLGSYNITVSGSTIENAFIGILLFTGNGEIENVSIAGNTISTCDVGIAKQSSQAYNFKNVSISNNTIDTVHTAVEITAAGANYAYASEIVISGNVIKDVIYAATSEAVLPGNAMRLSGQRVSAVDNVISNAYGSAILMYDVDTLTIKGGTIDNVNTTDETYGAIDKHAASTTTTNITVDGITLTDGNHEGVNAISEIKNSTVFLVDDGGSTNRAVIVSAETNVINNVFNYPLSMSNADNSIIIGNKFYYLNATDPGAAFIDCTNIDNALISHNTFIGAPSLRYAIWAHTNSSNLIITDNIATGYTSGSGVFYFQGENILFDNNLGTHSYYKIDLAVGDDIPVNTVMQIESTSGGGALVGTATPTIADGSFVGQEMTVLGEDDSDTFAIQDEGTLSGSNVQLGDTSRVFTADDVLMLKFDGTYWQETLWIDN